MKKLLIILCIDLIFFFSSYDWSCQRVDQANSDQTKVKVSNKKPGDAERLSLIYSEYIIV